MTSTEIAKPNITADEYRNITSLEDAMKLSAKHGGKVLVAEQVLGDGFSVTTDKKSLIGVPLYIMEWMFHEGKYQRDSEEGAQETGEFVGARIVAQTVKGLKKLIINDGGSGIYKQLKELSDSQNVFKDLYVERGLRVSEYTYKDSKGKEQPAKTFYLDTSGSE